MVLKTKKGNPVYVCKCNIIFDQRKIADFSCFPMKNEERLTPLDKPVQLGFTNLEFQETQMYKTHYILWNFKLAALL